MFGGKLQAPAFQHRQSHELAHDRAEAAIGQGLLHGGKHVLLPIALDEDDAVRIEARLGQRREKQVWTRQTPDDLAFGAGRNPGNEQGGGGSIDGTDATACELMKSAARKTASWQHGIDLGDTEGQAFQWHRRATPKGGDTAAQIGYDVRACSRHRSRNPLGSWGSSERRHAVLSIEVHVLFCRATRVKPV